MYPLKLCPWRHWFWITKATMAEQRVISVLIVVILCQAQLAIVAEAAPVGAVDTKGITFKKLALDDGADGKGLPGDKRHLAGVAAVSMSGGGGRKVQRITFSNNRNESPEDAVDDVMDGHEEISRIFVSLPTSTSTTTESNPSSTAEAEKQVTSESATGEIIPSTFSLPEGEGLLANEEDSNQNEEVVDTEIVELSSVEPIKTNPTETNQSVVAAEGEKDVKDSAATPSARIVHVSTNVLETEPNSLLVPGISIEDPERKIDNQNIQNLVLQEEDGAAIDLSGGNANRSRKSKGLTDNHTNKSHLTRSTDEEESVEPSNPEARLQSSSSLSRNILIQFNDNDRMELLSSQNNALTSDDSPRTRSSNLGLISGISFSVLALFCTVSLVGAMMYRRRYINKPQTLSEPDSSGYIDDSIIRVSVFLTTLLYVLPAF